MSDYSRSGSRRYYGGGVKSFFSNVFGAIGTFFRWVFSSYVRIVLFFVAVLVVVFLIAMAASAADYSADVNSTRKSFAKVSSQSVTVRYFLDDDEDNAQVKYIRYNNASSSAPTLSVPSKTGYRFVGYYGAPNAGGVMYVDSRGFWQVQPTGDLLLYPAFEALQ